MSVSDGGGEGASCLGVVVVVVVVVVFQRGYVGMSGIQVMNRNVCYLSLVYRKRIWTTNV